MDTETSEFEAAAVEFFREMGHVFPAEVFTPAEDGVLYINKTMNHIRTGWYVRQKEVDELKAELAVVHKAAQVAIRDAYESGFYEGAGDDAWYSDHGDEGELTPDAYVLKPMAEYMKEVDNLKAEIARLKGEADAR